MPYPDAVSHVGAWRYLCKGVPPRLNPSSLQTLQAPLQPAGRPCKTSRWGKSWPTGSSCFHRFAARDSAEPCLLWWGDAIPPPVCWAPWRLRSGVPVASPSGWAGEEESRGRELRLTTLKCIRNICYDTLTCSVSQISSYSRSPLPPHSEKPVQNANRRCRSGACTPPGFCLPVKVWDLGLIQFKSWGSTGKCRSAPGGTPSLLSPPNQRSRAKGSFCTDAPNCKCGDVFGLGYFRNQVSRSGLEWILNVHSYICCISPQFSVADHTVQYWMPKITTEESVFILSFLFHSLNSTSWICFTVIVPEQRVLSVRKSVLLKNIPF